MDIYAHPASQPSRSVLWFIALNGIDCRVHHDPDSNLSSINPRQQIPFLVDGAFTINEMPAILMYLAEKHQCKTWWPDNIENRARIQSYLHSHHTLTRVATLKLMAPHVLTIFNEPPMGPSTSTVSNTIIQQALADPEKLANGQSLMRDVLHVFESFYLSREGYIGGLAHPSIADLAAYEEIAQLTWAQLMDLTPFPRTVAWMAKMSTLAMHDETHRFNLELGDILGKPYTSERFMKAVSAGLKGLKDAGLRLID